MSMAFSEIQGQEEAVGFLRAAMGRGRIPSAYLFLGPHHVGKRTTALALAGALNCIRTREGVTGASGDESGEGCGVCPSCRKIAEDVHPDVETVRPDGQFIRIDQIRALSERLTLIPFEARKRVTILVQAERLNPQAANAFLKTLEEPPLDTLLVLCAEGAARLPETIVSRCVPVRFRPLSSETARGLLSRDSALEGEALDFAVRFSQGRLRPELVARSAHWMELREEMIKAMEGIRRPIFAQLSDEIARWCAAEDWRFVLEWLETWFRDLALLGAGADGAELINGDRLHALTECARFFTPEKAWECQRRVLATRDGIALNANKALALESLWLGFRELGSQR